MLHKIGLVDKNGQVLHCIGFVFSFKSRINIQLIYLINYVIYSLTTTINLKFGILHFLIHIKFFHKCISFLSLDFNL